MAKIGNLQVNTIKFTPNAVTGVTTLSGSGSGQNTGTAANQSGAPVRIFVVANISWTFLASGMNATWTVIVQRLNPAADVLPLQVSRSGGNTSGNFRMTGTVYDPLAQAGEQYRIIRNVSLQPGGTASTATYGAWSMSMLYRKR